jgi:hypothetical protein
VKSHFFSDVKNMEIGGAIKSVTKGEDNWWNFEHTFLNQI